MDFLLTKNLIILAILVLWVLPWKGYGMWTAAKRAHKGWFVALLVLNTFSILDIIYIFLVAKKSWQDIGKDLKGFLDSSKKENPPAI